MAATMRSVGLGTVLVIGEEDARLYSGRSVFSGMPLGGELSTWQEVPFGSKGLCG